VLAVCDVDTTRRNEAKARVDKAYANSDCKAFNDYRELLALPGIDAVVIATPDHWHAIQCLHAMAGKKDIYCEKPLTLTLAEGKALIDAARKQGTIFQTGSQQRSEYNHVFAQACEYVRSGRLGQVLTVHVGVGVSSRPCDLREEPMEPGLDWDKWLGPAPLRPYHSILSPRGVHNHYPNWRLYKEYSGGMMTDFGAHHFDIAQWGLGMDDSGPVEIIPPADEKTDHGCALVYAGGVRVVHGGPSGTTFIGDRGLIHVDRGVISSTPEGILKEPLKDGDVKLPRPASHLDDWFDCLRTRARPICDVEIGARSVACPLLCNLAYWHRRSMKWDPKAWAFADAEANGWRDYPRRAGYELPGV
jgi:predicted dehydrogenase